MIEMKILSDYGKVGKALHLTNGIYELVITIDVGPRILHFSRCSGENILAGQVEETMVIDDRQWHIYGGHRIWMAPECFPQTYSPDNDPVDSYSQLEDGLIVSQGIDNWTKIRKILEIRFKDHHVVIRNSLENCGAWNIETAVWSITIVKPGGRVLLPLNKRQSGFSPVSSYATWSYTRFNDSRVDYGDHWISLDVQEGNHQEYKLGYSNLNGWMAYCLPETCFIKQYNHSEAAKYPDFGSSSEVFVCHWGGEMETLSPLQIIKPGSILTHEEKWEIRDDIQLRCTDEPSMNNIYDAINNSRIKA